MPPLAIIYVLLVSVLAFDELLDRISGKLKPPEPAWRIAIDLATTAVVLLMFTGYWVKWLIRGMGLLGPGLLLISLVWDIWTTPQKINRTIRAEAEGVSPELRALARRLLIAVVLTLSVIGYWFGGIAALRDL